MVAEGEISFIFYLIYPFHALCYSLQPLTIILNPLMRRLPLEEIHDHFEGEGRKEDDGAGHEGEGVHPGRLIDYEKHGNTRKLRCQAYELEEKGITIVKCDKYIFLLILALVADLGEG